MDKPVSEMVVYYCGEPIDQMEPGQLIRLLSDQVAENQRLREENTRLRIQGIRDLAAMPLPAPPAHIE